MKPKTTKLSPELFATKTKIEQELILGNKTNENLLLLIYKAINFLKAGRDGQQIPKKLPLFKHFQEKFGTSNISIIKLSKQARAIYTTTATNEIEILRIILKIYQTHKEYEKEGKYNKH